MSWEKIRFGDIYSENSRNGISVTKSQHNGTVKIVNMGELFANDFIGDIDMRRINVEETQLKRFSLMEGDLLFARRSLVAEGAGKVAMVERVTEPTVFESSIIRVRLNSEIAFPAFYEYWFNSFDGRDAIARLVTGTNVKGIRGSELGNISVPFPSFNVQQRIAGVLSAYDKLIENNRKQIKLLEEAAQRLYKEWFVDLRFPGHETTPIRDGIPEGWKKMSLLAQVDYVRGRSYGTEDIRGTGAARLINLNNVASYGGWNAGAEKPYSGNYKEGQIVESGDVIMAVTDMTKERRLVGHVARIPKTATGGIISMDLIKLIPKSLESSYLYAFLRFSGVAEMIAMLANGTNVIHLKPEALGRVEMFVPSQDSQMAYAEHIQPMLDAIETAERQIAAAREARDRLLPKLMSGEIEV